MNDLQTIKAHHDGLPGPAPQVAARAWDRLTAEAEAERAGGAPHEPGPSRPRRLHGLGRGRVALRAVAVAGLAAAVTAGVIVVGGDDGSSPFGARPANAAELLRYAAVVAAGEDPKPRPDQFLYVDRKDVTWTFGFGRGDGRYEYAQDVRREVWVPAADPGKALARSTFGKKHTIRGRSLVPGEVPGTVEYQRAGQCHMDVTRAPSKSAGDLPTDPDLLLTHVREEAEAVVRAEKPAPGEAPASGDQINRRIERTVVMKLILLLENPFTSSQTRAVVFGALSRLPTATMVPELTDPAGRRGLGVSISYQGPDGLEREELVFEPETYKFLGWQSWMKRTGGLGGTGEVMRGGTAIMTVKVVDSMPEVPKDAKTPTYC
ncbi:CU044_5270 family protein [Streptosporangium sp. NBC_01469]|uniref:CU044_5270 family protein n=1 Tax=Streptosporangium sp. NBC_01469 TaxID=2903898 RepID=UPI002E2E0C5A|nr:CU044_5270 family protein [Streptosporangium sp. NBC_01469]